MPEQDTQDAANPQELATGRRYNQAQERGSRYSGRVVAVDARAGTLVIEEAAAAAGPRDGRLVAQRVSIVRP